MYVTSPVASIKQGGRMVGGYYSVRTLKCTVFSQTADEEGTGELDIEAFKAKMAPHLGQGTSDTELMQLFMKIDADCGGTVDW